MATETLEGSIIAVVQHPSVECSFSSLIDDVLEIVYLARFADKTSRVTGKTPRLKNLAGIFIYILWQSTIHKEGV